MRSICALAGTIENENDSKITTSRGKPLQRLIACLRRTRKVGTSNFEQANRSSETGLTQGRRSLPDKGPLPRRHEEVPRKTRGVCFVDFVPSVVDARRA